MIEEGIQTATQTFASLSMDAFFIGGLFALLAIAGLVGGKREQLTLAIAIYPTALLMLIQPPLPAPAMAQLVIFIGIYALSVFILRRFIYGYYSERKLFKAIEIAGMAAATTAALVALMVHTNALGMVYSFSASVGATVSHPFVFFGFLAAPLITLIVLVRR